MSSYVPSTTNVWPNYAAGNTSGNNSGPDKAMGKDEFLKILIAQIKNQDPMQPMQDREFIAQMAQFTSVEQLMNMAGSLDRLANSIGMSSSLIGKMIGWVNESDPSGGYISGFVEAIMVRDGKTYAVTAYGDVPLDKILFVADGHSNNPDERNDEQEGGNEG